jgi:predicted component of type VI protein secretion system
MLLVMSVFAIFWNGDLDQLVPLLPFRLLFLMADLKVTRSTSRVTRTRLSAQYEKGNFPFHVASMSRGVSCNVLEALKTHGNFCDMTRHEIDGKASQCAR